SLKADDVAVVNEHAIDLAGVEAVRADAPDFKGKIVFLTSAEMRREGIRRQLREKGAVLAVITGFRPRTRTRLIDPTGAEPAPTSTSSTWAAPTTRPVPRSTTPPSPASISRRFPRRS